MADDNHLTLHQKNSSTEEKMSNKQAGDDEGSANVQQMVI